MKPVLILQHMASDSPGYLSTWLERQGIAYVVANAGIGESFPQDMSPYAALAILATGLIIFLAGLPIIHTRECHKPDLSDLPKAKHLRGKPSMRIGDPGPMGRILIAGEPGADIIPELAARPGEIVLDKPGKGAFYATPLSQILADKKITHLVFAGVTTEVCVQTTMREANDRGFECLLAEDATESYFPEFKEAAVEMIRAQGAIVGWTASVDQIAKALRG